MRMAIFAVLAACTGGGGSSMLDPDAATTSDTTPEVDAYTIIDQDNDGLDDLREQQLAEDYLPFISMDPGDGCPLSGLVARVRPHPADPAKVLIVYSHLFQRDCGLAGHIGDNEAFGIAIDPNLPAPTGILAIRTASHQNTPCERISDCTTCAGDSRPQCDVTIANGAQWPVLYASKDKHGQYATKSKCGFGTCFDQCTLNAMAQLPPITNVGEPGHAFTHDLTANGFITPANGWTEAELMNFDPWDATKDFGGAGNIAGDLQDSTFEPALCN
ncbi:MAG TPA: hypothetical protein VFV99_18275 [Kofleriaceae bacterium]|nr:hypothetical protein [Kofleriaceae bacterium]